MDNNIFSFGRFLKVLKYDLKFRVPAIGTLFLALLAIPHALHQLMDFRSSFPVGQRLDVYGVMCVFLIFYAPFKIYPSFKTKHGLGSFIMLPASSLEKFASMVLILLVLVPAIFLLCIYLLDSVMLLLLTSQYSSIVTVDYDILAKGALGLFVIVSTSVLGNTLFKKGAPGKTLLSILVLLFLWLGVITRYIFDNFIADGNADVELLQRRGEMVVNISMIVYFAAAVLFYTLAYFRIKRIQIS